MSIDPEEREILRLELAREALAVYREVEELLQHLGTGYQPADPLATWHRVHQLARDALFFTAGEQALTALNCGEEPEIG